MLMSEPMFWAKKFSTAVRARVGRRLLRHGMLAALTLIFWTADKSASFAQQSPAQQRPSQFDDAVRRGPPPPQSQIPSSPHDGTRLRVTPNTSVGPGIGGGVTGPGVNATTTFR